MKTINISITVPDGVEVKVSGATEDGFTEKPDPPEPEGVCPVHGTPWRMVKGGISKRTQKRFNSFWVCSTQDCNVKPGQVVDELPW
jgi:hypothetical protein